jgi:hypothetical protein
MIDGALFKVLHSLQSENQLCWIGEKYSTAAAEVAVATKGRASQLYNRPRRRMKGSCEVSAGQNERSEILVSRFAVRVENVVSNLTLTSTHYFFE